jgi:hypothetical protein
MTQRPDTCQACEVHPLKTCEACTWKRHPVSKTKRYTGQPTTSDTQVVSTEELQRVAKEAELNAAEIEVED